MRPANLKTRMFLDSGDPEETKEAIRLLGFLDGQTTNPTLVSKTPTAREMLESGKKFSRNDLLKFYKMLVEEISALIPHGSVSIEVYADKNTRYLEMFDQGKEMFSWIPNARIKYPTTPEGLYAAVRSLHADMPINMTLCFTQEQAAAVHAVTGGGLKRGTVFVSPFVGRLDDRGLDGMSLIKNIKKMYSDAGSHIEILTASVRSLGHLLYAIQLDSDIVTLPLKVIREWAETGLKLPDENFVYTYPGLKPIEYRELNLGQYWQRFDIYHELTDTGMEKFSQDWRNLIK